MKSSLICLLLLLIAVPAAHAQLQLLELLLGVSEEAAGIELVEAETLAARTATVTRTAARASVARPNLVRFSAAHTPYAEIELAEETEAGWAFRNRSNGVVFRTRVEGEVTHYLNAEGREFGYSAERAGSHQVQHFRMVNGRAELLGYDDVVSDSRLRHFSKDGKFLGDTTFEVSRSGPVTAVALLALGFTAAQATEDRATTSSAPTPSALVLPPPEQSLGGARFVLRSLEILDDRLTLMIEISATEPGEIAATLRARELNGLLDFGHVHPTSEAVLTDAQGRRFPIVASDLQLDQKDLVNGSGGWTVIGKGEKRLLAFSFDRHGQSVGNIFSLTVPLRMSWVAGGRQLTEPLTLFLHDIDAGRFIKSSR